MEERIAERLPVLATVPRQASVEKAAIMGRTILGFERSSTAARAYVEFARGLLTSLGLRGGAK
jgi:nitrogenase subunit NifH